MKRTLALGKKLKQFGLITTVVAVVASSAALFTPTQANAATCDQLMFRRGSSGTCVRYLQRLLNVLRPVTETLVADGQFGSITERRVKAFQRNEHISSDGIVGPVTWRRICNPSYHSVHNSNYSAYTYYKKQVGC